MTSPAEQTLKSHEVRVDAMLTAKIHEGFTVAADQLAQRGYITQEQRRALSGLIGKSLDTFMTGIDPTVAAAMIDPECADEIASKESIYQDVSALCPSCSALVSFPSGGWYQCPACGEPFYASETDSDSDYADDWRMQKANSPDVSEADIPKELEVATLIRAPEGETTKVYNGVSAALWPRMESCVSQVMGKGHDKSSAIAICHVAIMGKKETGEDAAIDEIATAQKECGCGGEPLPELVEAEKVVGAPKGVTGLFTTLVNRARGRTKEAPISASEPFPVVPDVAEVSMPEATVWDNAGVIDTIFKDARTGLMRWVIFSSSAYEDADKEIVSAASLDRDSERMTTTKSFGPLRWWHVGNPDRAKLSPGPGLDLGTCDFSAMHGNIAVESGLFNDNAVAEAFIPRLKELGVSRGFFHPVFEPDEDGVFHNIYTFERSILPRGKASNRLTQLYVTKEATMRNDKLKVFKGLVGDELAEKVLSTAGSLDQAAAAQGLKSKEAGDVADVPAIVAIAETDKAAKPKARKVALGKDEEDAADEADAADEEELADKKSGETPVADESMATGTHNHLHVHDNKMHSHTHFHPAVHQLVNTNNVAHTHEHGSGETTTLKEATAYLPSELAALGYLPQPEAKAAIDTTDVDEFAELQVESYKEMIHAAFMDVLKPFLEGLSAASIKQSEKAAGETAELRATLKTQAEKLSKLESLFASLLGDQPKSTLKEMRASQAEHTVVGANVNGANVYSNGHERLKESQPTADHITDFITQFVVGGEEVG